MSVVARTPEARSSEAGAADLDSLVDRARSGDLDAYESIVRRFQDMAVGYAYALLGDFHLAEDAAQEAFVGAYASLPQLRAAPAFTGWFRQIVFRQCQQARRRQQLDAVSVEAVGELASSDPGPDIVAETRLARDQLLTVVRALPRAESEVITLFYMGERSQREIAGFLNISVDTVKNRLRSGRGKLQRGLLDMTGKTLRDQAPSRDDAFVTVVTLCNAAGSGDLMRVQQLLHENPELARRPISQNGQLAVQFAAREGHASVVALLLEAGANPLQGVYPNRRATSALAYARDRNHAEVVRRIEEHLERHPPVEPEPDQTARLLTAVADDDLETAAALLQTDPTLANAEASVEAARTLRAAEIPANRPAIFPLRLAAQLGQFEMARLLLDSGADPDAPHDLDLGDEGTYRNAGEPLWLAASGGHYALCELLLKRGADPNAYVFASGPAAERAMENGDDEILDLLYRYGGKGFAVAAAMCGRIAVPAEVMALQPELAPQILWAAALAGNVDLVRLCFQYDLKELNWFGGIYSVLRGRRRQAQPRYADGQRDELTDKVEILRVVLENGADPKARDSKNMTLLHRLAGETSHWEDEEKISFARLLLDFGADIHARDDELQSTPLGHAARYGHAKLAEFLLERGAQTRLPDDPPWATPLAWAEKHGHDAIAALLRQRERRAED